MLQTLIEKYEDAIETLPIPSERDEVDWIEYNLWSEFLDDLRTLH